MDRESLKLLLAQGLSVEKIAKRFGKHPSTVSYWMAKHGLEAVNRDRHAARGGIGREELKACVEAGMTIAEIADHLSWGRSTVRHWLRRHGLRTRHQRGKRSESPTHLAKDAGVATIVMSCAHHGETEFFLEGRGYYRCKRCRSDAVARRRRRLKEILVAEAGGKCCLCGYDRHVAALHFHHLEPSLKQMPLSAPGYCLCARHAASRGEEVRSTVLKLPRGGGERSRDRVDTVSASFDRRYTVIRGNSTGRVFGC